MGTLNPDLISKDVDAVLNDAVSVKDQYRKTTLTPEAILLALLRSKDTAAARLMEGFKQGRGIDVERLTRQVQLAAESRTDQNGNLEFMARANRIVPLSRQSIILIDDALTLANSQNEIHADTDHILAVMSEASVSTSGLLRQHGITPKAIADMLVTKKDTIRDNTTLTDYAAQAKAGKLRAVFFRENLLRDMNNILSQSVNRHILLIGPDGVGKRTLAYSLALLIAEGKGPRGLTKLVQIDEAALLDSDQKAVRAGLNEARGGILFIPHLHRFFGGPIKAEFSKGTPMIQKAFLDNDPVIIGTTTEIEYTQRIVPVSAITEHSQLLRVGEPSIDETIEILKVMRPHLESDYKLEIDEDVLGLAVRLAKRYMNANPLPRSAEQLMHRAAAMVNMSQDSMIKPGDATQANGGSAPATPNTLDAEDVTLALSQMTGVPVNKLGEDERGRYASMVEHLQERVIGQDQAVLAVSRAIKTARVGLKTHVARLARSYSWVPRASARRNWRARWQNSCSAAKKRCCPWT